MKENRRRVRKLVIRRKGLAAAMELRSFQDLKTQEYSHARMLMQMSSGLGISLNISFGLKCRRSAEGKNILRENTKENTTISS